jgi:outer membrane protein insertion porin family
VSRRLFYGFSPVFLSLLLALAAAQTVVPPHPAPAPRQAIRDVSFEEAAALTPREQQDIALSLRRYNPDWVTAQTSEQLANFIASKVLAVYQEKGYWRARVSAKVSWVTGEDGQPQVDALIRPLEEGEQYWLKEIRWTGMTVFPENELVSMMPIRPWELISRDRVAEGLEVVRKLYAARGYFAYRALPEIEFDDAAHSVTLQIAVEEDQPFRFGNLSVSGLDKAASQAMQQGWVQMREETYSQDRLRSFFEKYFRNSRPGVDPLNYASSSVDLDTHTIDIQVSLSPTTQAEKSEQ